MQNLLAIIPHNEQQGQGWLKTFMSKKYINYREPKKEQEFYNEPYSIHCVLEMWSIRPQACTLLPICHVGFWELSECYATFNVSYEVMMLVFRLLAAF
jgi:hypothetical protein